MRNTLLNLLGILVFGLLFSALLGFGMHMAEKRELANTAASERYSVIEITGSLEMDSGAAGIPGTTAPYPHKLKFGRKVYLLDFTDEPAIKDFAEERADSYLKISGVKRIETSEAPDGTKTDWVVIKVLKIKAFKPR